MAIVASREGTSSFSNIKQKLEEPYEDVISPLTEAVHRVIYNLEAAGILIKELAFENSNSTWQDILRPIKNFGQIVDYIRQCADIGPAVMQDVAIAAARKGNSYQQAVQSFFLQTGITRQRVIPVVQARILVYPMPASLVDERGTLYTLAPQKQPVLICQILPPQLCLLTSLGLLVLVVRKDIIG